MNLIGQRAFWLSSMSAWKASGKFWGSIGIILPEADEGGINLNTAQRQYAFARRQVAATHWITETME